jgi:hypothetical protein
MVVAHSFTNLNITLSNQKFINCRPIVDVGFVKLTPDGSVETGPWRWIFSSPVTCAAILLDVLRSLFVNVQFFPLFLLADVAFPWFVYADITLESVSLDIPNNVAVSSQMLQPNAHPWSVLFQNRSGLPFSDSFTRIVTQQSHKCSDVGITDYKQTEKEHSKLPTEVLKRSQYKFYSSIS